MTPLCRAGSTVLAPLFLPYQISAEPVNNNSIITKYCIDESFCLEKIFTLFLPPALMGEILIPLAFCPI